MMQKLKQKSRNRTEFNLFQPNAPSFVLNIGALLLFLVNVDKATARIDVQKYCL